MQSDKYLNMQWAYHNMTHLSINILLSVDSINMECIIKWMAYNNEYDT